MNPIQTYRRFGKFSRRQPKHRAPRQARLSWLYDGRHPIASIKLRGDDLWHVVMLCDGREIGAYPTHPAAVAAAHEASPTEWDAA